MSVCLSEFQSLNPRNAHRQNQYKTVQDSTKQFKTGNKCNADEYMHACRKFQNVAECMHNVEEYCRMFKNVTECMQNVPEYVQNVPECSRMHRECVQNVPECMQNVPECM